MFFSRNINRQVKQMLFLQSFLRPVDSSSQDEFIQFTLTRASFHRFQTVRCAAPVLHFISLSFSLYKLHRNTSKSLTFSIHCGLYLKIIIYTTLWEQSASFLLTLCDRLQTQDRHENDKDCVCYQSLWLKFCIICKLTDSNCFSICGIMYVLFQISTLLTST